MNEELISFETAKLAKEKGFNECVDNHYCYGTNGDYTIFMDDMKNDEHANNECAAPTQSLLQKWLREKHNIHVTSYLIRMFYNEEPKDQEPEDFSYTYQILINGVDGPERLMDVYSSFEKALEQGLYESLKLIND